MVKKGHVALYGNTKLLRAWCNRCKQFALVLDGRMACCDQTTYTKPKKVIRMTGVTQVRKQPPKKARQELLEKYHWSCAYCEQPFGSYTQYHGEPRKILLAWDHKVPWKYNQNNHAGNSLPACRFCNAWKSDLIFEDVDAVKVYVQQKWLQHQKEDALAWKSSVSQSENNELPKNVNTAENASP